MTLDHDRTGVRRGFLSSRSRARATGAAIASLVAVAALAASPEVPSAAAAPVTGPVPTSATATVPAPTPTPTPTTTTTTTTDPGSVAVMDPVVVVNRDGSATISAELTNSTDTEVALMDVRVGRGGDVMAVSRTPMWLPVLPGQPARVGDASDAGGFVIPAGAVPGTNLTLQFLFDSGACLTEQADVVVRTAQHRSVYPKDGTRLGPATRPAGENDHAC
ncbi:MAG: hypothetical protein ABWX74_15610 [Aeromicrobium sp.]